MEHLESLFKALNPSLHEILVTGAFHEGKTLNAFVRDVLERATTEGHLAG
jgi:predicted HicB family RNase H-like nuclease